MVQSIALHHLFVFGEWELPSAPYLRRAAAADGADRGNVGTAPYSGWKRPSGRTRRGTQAPPYRDLAPQDTRGIP